MAEALSIEKNKRFYFNRIPDVLFRPRQAFKRIASTQNAIWITPLLVISALVLINVLVAGKLKQQIALMGGITYPQDYQYWTPEMQAQYTQAAQSTQGPVFVYVLPAIGILISTWVGWLILGGMLHLVTTLLGGRGSTAISMNIVAWGSLPYAVRAVVQIIYMLITNKLISNPGISGFMPAGDSGGLVFVSQLIRLIDVYLIWQVILLFLGVRASTGLNTSKSITGVTIAVVVILLLQAGLAYAGSLLGNLTIIRPFLF